ncbi:unnamed protein product, partial [Didymodactylos carnosus]
LVRDDVETSEWVIPNTANDRYCNQLVALQ